MTVYPSNDIEPRAKPETIAELEAKVKKLEEDNKKWKRQQVSDTV